MSIRYEMDAQRRETAYLGTRIVGHIVPDAIGYGGWVWVFPENSTAMSIPVLVTDREAARMRIESTVAP